MPPQLVFSNPAKAELQLVLAGSWTLTGNLPPVSAIQDRLRDDIASISFDGTAISNWDTGLLTWLVKLIKLAKDRNIHLNLDGLPDGVHRLITLATAVPPTVDTGRHKEEPPLFERIGLVTLSMWRAAPEMLRFLGELTLSFGRLLRGKAQFRRGDLMVMIEDVGPRAFPIVTLISFLTGLIIAYMGAVQLAQFGAQIYIANLVGLGMTREIAALMTGIIMAGRTGAAYAAQLGTMQVNEEIDAFRTLGINPIDFLVLPRMLALVIIMPMMVLYAGIVGITAGMFVAVTSFDISTFEYYTQTVRSIGWWHIGVGVIKATVYGMLIAFAGCLRGMQCGRSAQAVGEATTSAVVTSILLIVIAASLLTIMFQQLGI